MMRGMQSAGPETIRIAAPAPPAPNGWPPAVLAGIERELARFVGPLAATLVRRAAQQHATIEALIAALLPSIEGQQDRDAFARTCGRRAVMHPAPSSAPAAPTAAPATEPTPLPMPARASPPRAVTATTGTTLLRAADPLLGVLPRLRNTKSLADPAALRAQLRQQLAAFEAEAAAGGASPSHIAVARSLLCHFVDEVIAASPWGAQATQSTQGTWAAHALASAQAADPIDLLQTTLLADAAAQAPLLELFHVCIGLGFAGRLGHSARGKAELDALAARLHALLATRRGRSGAARTLSPRWRGLATRGHRDLALLPLWAAVALGGALLLALWLTASARLDARARPVFARVAALPGALQSERAAAPRPRLAALLPSDAQIDVRDDAQRSLITLPADALFVTDGARLERNADALLGRVAQALRGALAQGGEVAVIGHGDDAPPASLQFPTGWHLTRARAQAVADALVARRVAPVRAEGRAEFEPRAPNATPAGRAQNRRIEIELRLRRPETEPPEGAEAGSKPTCVGLDGPKSGCVSQPRGLQGPPAARQSRFRGSRLDMPHFSSILRGTQRDQPST